MEGNKHISASNSHETLEHSEKRSVPFGCCLGFGSFMPQVETNSSGGDKASSPDQDDSGKALNPLMEGIRLVLRNGYDFVELTVGALMQLSERDFEEAALLLNEMKVTIPFFNSFIPPALKVTGPEADPEQLEAYVDQAMKRVKAVGGTQIIFGSGKARNVPDGFPMEQAMEQIRHFLRMCEAYASRNDLLIAIEPLNRKESNIINSVTEALELAEELQLSRVKVLADAYHMHLDGEDFVVVNRAIGMNMLSHVHISEYDRSFPLDRNGAPGVDFAAFFRQLRQAGYTGAVSAECSQNDLAAHCGPSLDYIKRVWAQS